MADDDDDERERGAGTTTVGKLAAGIAHDFNNLLTVITSCAAFIREGLPTDSPLHADVDDIRAAAERAAVLTRELLAAGRQEVVVARAIDLGAVVRELAPAIEKQLHKGVRLHVEIGASVELVRADRTLVERVIMTLVANACEGLRDGGNVRLRIERRDIGRGVAGREGVAQGTFLRLSVSDDGKRMAPADLERVFEPFFANGGRGTGGLGLSSVRGIARQSGGFASAESRAGGNTFSVHLPVAVGAVGADEEAASTAASEPIGRSAVLATSPGGTASGRILLVDDEAGVRSVARRLLEREGYTVVVAENGRAALQLAREQPPFDLLLTDVTMPGLAGPDLYDDLRKRQPDLTVLYMSGYTSDPRIRRGLVDASVAFVAKPFRAQELLASVRRAIAPEGDPRTIEGCGRSSR